MVNDKKPIKVTYPKFNIDEENPYQEEMDKLIDISLAEAGTTRTLKNVTECLAKSLKSKYGITDKKELQEKTEALLKLHGLSREHFDPLATVSKLTFGNLQTINDVSVDDNANKSSTNMEAIAIEASLPYKKLAGYDYLYQTIKELYGKKEAKKCMASMFDYSLLLNDSTKILMPYSYYGHTSILIRINYNDIRMVTLKKLWEMYEHHANGEFIDTTDLKDQFVVENVYLSRADKFKGTQNNCKIKNLPCIKQHLEVWDLKNGWVDMKRIIKHQTDKDFIFYQTNNGDFALVTEDHPIYMSDGTEKLAKDLKIEDEILKEDLNLPDVYKNIEIDEKLAYVSGFLLGDGNYNAASLDYSKKTFDKRKEGLFWRKGGNGISVYQNDIQNSYIKNQIDESFNNINWFKFSDKQNRCLSFSSYDYNYMLANLFGYTYKENSYTKHLPENFNAWTDESIYAFLAGLIDSDGSVVDNFVTIRMASYAVINQLYDVLYKDSSFKGLKKILDKQCEDKKLVCGFVFRVLKDHPLIKLSKKLENAFKANPNKFEKYETKYINSRQDDKIAKIYRFNRNDVAKTSFFNQELEDVYDITTASGRFYANGMVQHNCYCIDASKLVTEGRNFGTVHSSPAHRISTYISMLGDTIREISFTVAGAIAAGTLFLDVSNLAIYRERITLDDLRNDRKVRKAMTNHFQQFIYTVNHYSRNAIESPFTNVSCFDRDKLRGLIGEDNYAWYFPKKAAVVEDNGLENTKEAFTEFVLDYIEELQEIYLDLFDKGDPLRNGLQFTFPVTTINLGITINPDGTRELTSPNNRLYEYITKKDISKYNIFCSEGTKCASCCRLLSNAEMLNLGSGVNSFGGSQVSLGSHRVVTIDFSRCAYEAESYDDFKKIITERVEEMSKILHAHRILIHKLEKCGTQPWVTNGWIQMSHLFSTFGCIGYVEADQILKFKFNHADFDYLKDFISYFNSECHRIGEEMKMIWNIEAIPGEGSAPKLAQANKIIFADENGNYCY